MTNIVRCPVCKKSFIAEELSLHSCTGSKRIVDLKYKWWVNSHIDGIGEIVIVQADDGTIFRIKPISNNPR